MLDLDRVRSGLRAIGRGDTQDFDSCRRRCRVRAAGCRECAFGLEDICRIVKADGAAQLIDGTAEIAGEGRNVVQNGELGVIVRNTPFERVDRDSPSRNDAIDSRLAIDAATKAGKRDPVRYCRRLSYRG